MADTNILGQVPESNNIDSLYTEVDNTLSLVHEVPSTITETSIHNTTSVNLGTDRENDDSLKINKEEKVSLRGLEDKKNTYAPTANLDVAHFADKRFISKQLSDKNDTVIMADLDKEIIRSYETDVVLANALNLEDEEREIADAQLRADIAKEALERANADSNLAEIIEKYKYAMSQHITTRELDVNGDARINLEVQDADYHGGNLEVQTSLVVGNEDSNGLATEEGKIIGDAHIKHDLIVDNDTTIGHDTTIGNDFLVKNDSHIMNDLLVGQNTTIEGNLDVNGTTTLNELEVENNLSVDGNLKVKGDTDLDKTLNVDGETTLNANVKIKDDSNAQKSFSDIIGTIKNALVKDFTQSYNSTTGQLTSTLTFNNLYSGNTNRPTVSTITKTINLDLEKYILDINDVYATKTISNGKTTYTDFDISTLTDEEIRDLDSPDYTGNIVRCLKVKYNTYNNTNAGTEKSYVYFEINDIFKSIISKLELEINNEITARNDAITNAINNLDVASVGSNGGYIKTISETNGKISAAAQGFDTTISGTSTHNNAPTSKAVSDYIYAYLKNHEKRITLKDAAGKTLLSFICYAPTTTDYSPALGNITLNTTTII